MQLIQKLALSAVQCVLWCSCLDLASAMTQSSSYCFTNTHSCRAGGFPSHLFAILSTRPDPLLFIKSDRRPQIGLQWLLYTIYAILALQLPYRRNNGYSFSYLTWEPKCFEAPMRGTVIAIQCRRQHFVKDGRSILCSQRVLQLCVASLQKSHTVISVVDLRGKRGG